MKYIETQDNLIIFSNLIKHIHLSRTLDLNPISAGFIHFDEDNKISFFGDSISLNLKSSKKTVEPNNFHLFFDKNDNYPIFSKNKIDLSSLSDANSQEYNDYLKNTYNIEKQFLVDFKCTENYYTGEWIANFTLKNYVEEDLDEETKKIFQRMRFNMLSLSTS